MCVTEDYHAGIKISSREDLATAFAALHAAGPRSVVMKSVDLGLCVQCLNSAVTIKYSI